MINREFNFVDLYDKNNQCTDDEYPSLEFFHAEDVDSVNRSSFVEISGLSDDPVICTYAKFVEIMDSEGLEGLAVL